MAKKMSDDEIMDYTYNKLFGDLDNIRSGSMFSDKEEDLHKVTDNAGTAGLEGIELTIKPLMKAASESGREPESGEPESANPEEEELKHLKGIGRMSPLMAQLHGER